MEAKVNEGSRDEDESIGGLITEDCCCFCPLTEELDGVGESGWVRNWKGREGIPDSGLGGLGGLDGTPGIS